MPDPTPTSDMHLPYPMPLMPHQRSLLRYMFNQDYDFSTIVYSTVKKSGKTAVGGAVGRWITETWGSHTETYFVANDMEQARGRAYKSATTSIELTPGYDQRAKELPGRWRIIEKEARSIPNHGTMRAISGDYRGEAGSNPTASLWTELWGYTTEASRRLWDQLTPPPTRKRAFRFIETYAGYEDESDLLLAVYKSGLEGRRLTHDDIDWPFPDQPPVWVNERARMIMYWDSGVVARRMPWQTPAYYASESEVLRPEAFRQLHLNEWTSSIQTFIPIEWWHRLADTAMPPLDTRTPAVLGIDASVSGDCTAIAIVTRHPSNERDVMLRDWQVWYPPKGGTINLADVEARVRELCVQYNIVQIAYDAYQLHKMMTDLVLDAVAWCRPFSQGADRAKADKQLYDLIKDKRITHPGGGELARFVQNCAAQRTALDNEKLRLVKKTQDGKIDPVVALSMASYECLRLLL